MAWMHEHNSCERSMANRNVLYALADENPSVDMPVKLPPKLECDKPLPDQ